MKRIMKYHQISDKILRSFYDVYNSLGYGFQEKVYEAAMLNELSKKKLSVLNQYLINVFYKEEIVGDYIADIVVDNKIIIELKTSSKIHPHHECQLLNYLNATKFEVGLLLNFGPKPEKIRKVYDNDKKIYFQNYKSPNKAQTSDKVDAIIDSFHTVYRYFGFGFQEMVYRNAWEVELRNSCIDFKRDFPLSIFFNNQKIGEYFSEFYFDDLIIKIISRKEITLQDEKIMVNILKSTNVKSGLILNFGYTPEIKRKFKDKKMNCVHGLLQENTEKK